MAFEGRIGHLEEIESPWGNAGGVVKYVGGVERMAHTGVGWIEVGSYTLEPRPGNSPNLDDVYFHDPETGETTNSLGMPNQGMDKLVAELPEMVRIAHSLRKPLVVNVAPVSEDPAMESVELIRRAYDAGADAVLLNAGCPNVVSDDGSRHELLSRNPREFFLTLATIADCSALLPAPIFVRISPRESKEAGQAILDVIRRNEQIISAVFTPNTWPGFVPLDDDGNAQLKVPGGQGGRSGPAMANESRHEVAAARQALSFHNIDIVSSSSIMTAQELGMRLNLGAVAGAGTTFFYETQDGWAEDVDRMMREFTEL